MVCVGVVFIKVIIVERFVFIVFIVKVGVLEGSGIVNERKGLVGLFEGIIVVIFVG